MSELQEIIAKNAIAAFNAGLRSGIQSAVETFNKGYEVGRQAERDYFWKAIDLNATSNQHGDFIYLADLKDAIEELDAKRKENNLP